MTWYIMDISVTNEYTSSWHRNIWHTNVKYPILDWHVNSSCSWIYCFATSRNEEFAFVNRVRLLLVASRGHFFALELRLWPSYSVGSSYPASLLDLCRIQFCQTKTFKSSFLCKLEDRTKRSWGAANEMPSKSPFEMRQGERSSNRTQPTFQQ